MINVISLERRLADPDGIQEINDNSCKLFLFL